MLVTIPIPRPTNIGVDNKVRQDLILFLRPVLLRAKVGVEIIAAGNRMSLHHLPPQLLPLLPVSHHQRLTEMQPPVLPQMIRSICLSVSINMDEGNLYLVKTP